MRIIYGEKGHPNRTHLLIVRGIDDDAAYYFAEHVKRYPTWGLIVCLDRGQECTTKYVSDEAPVIAELSTSIHKFVLCEDGLSDEKIVELVLRDFPPYNEDSDPVIPEGIGFGGLVLPGVSPDYTDAMLVAARAVTKKRPIFEKTSVEDYRKKFGSYPGEPIRPDISLPVKIMQMSQKVDLRELFRFSPHSREDVSEETIKKIPPEIINRIKRNFAEQLVECDNFWDITCSASDGFHLSVIMRIAVAPMGDLEKDNPYRLSSDYLSKKK